MKKLTLVAVIAAFFAMIANSYAEVQQVRLSGELRLRAYWTHNISSLSDNNPIGFNDNDTYISQRTRVTVEADLEDHVMVVVTLQARNVWGRDGVEPTGFAAGTGHPQATPASIVHLVEGFVRFQELFWSPLTATIGRQGLHFGNGLIFSNTDKEHRFDAVRLTWEMADHGLTFDLVAGKLVDRTTGGGAFNSARDSDFWFFNARWEPKDMKFIQDIEAYMGYRTAFFGGANDTFVTTIGLRGDVTPLPDKAKSWKIWWELAVQMGSDGAFQENLNGYLFDIGSSYVLDNMNWKPTVWAGYTVASGHRFSESPGNRHFVPWFDYATRGGFVMSPILSNIQILGFGAMASPNDKWSFAGAVYRYMQDRQDFGNGNAGPFGYGGAGNPFTDNGGVTAPTANNRSLGWEFNVAITYAYSKDVKSSIQLGWFAPGSGYDFPGAPKADDAMEARFEITINF